MEAIITKDFPLFFKKGDEGDECPKCHSVIVSIGFDRGVCPSCACIEIQSLRSRLASLETLLHKQHYALNSVKHDRPSAHSDFIWEQINEALAAYEAYKDSAGLSGSVEGKGS